MSVDDAVETVGRLDGLDEDGPLGLDDFEHEVAEKGVEEVQHLVADEVAELDLAVNIVADVLV